MGKRGKGVPGRRNSICEDLKSRAHKRFGGTPLGWYAWNKGCGRGKRGWRHDDLESDHVWPPEPR